MLTVVECERPRRIRSSLSKDFDGTGEWTFEGSNGTTVATLDWRPSVNHGLIRRLTPVLRPLFRSNHTWAMRRGERRLRGYLAGCPVADFRVVLYDGQYHDVDSNELSFKTAGWLAFKDGMSKARPTLLEPIMNVEVYAPSDYAGDLMGDLNGRRGRIGGMEPRGMMTVIRAQVPMAEMLTYEQHLTSVTGGRGSYHMEFSHYDEVPQHQQQKIIAAFKAEKGQAVEEQA